MKVALFFLLIFTLILNFCLPTGFTHGSYAHKHVAIKGSRNGTQYTALGGERSFHRFTTVSFSHDSSILATLVQNKALHLWDVSTGTYLKTLTDQIGGKVTSMSFSPNDSILATGNRDGTVHLWDVSTGTRLRILSTTFAFWETTVEGYLEITILTFSHDGSILATGNRDGTGRLWDVSTGTLIEIPKLASDITGMLFSRDDRVLATLIDNHTVDLRDISSGTFISTLINHGTSDYFVSDLFNHDHNISFYINSMSISPDGKTLATGMTPVAFSELGIETDEIFTIWLWDTTTGQQKAVLGGWYDVGDISFSPDGRTLAATTSIGADLWDVSTGKLLSTLGGQVNSNSLSFSPDGNTLAVGSWRGTVHLWDISTKALRKILVNAEFGITDVSFSPDGATLATVNIDGSVFLWDIEPSEVPLSPIEDVNNDGAVNIADLVGISSEFGQMGTNCTDVNGDKIVDIVDLLLVAGTIEIDTYVYYPYPTHWRWPIIHTDIQQWLMHAQQLNPTDLISLRGITLLTDLLAVLTPQETALFQNYPNPFNPDTWIPYMLAAPADVRLRIYSATGTVVRTLALGYQSAGIYQHQSRAVYWDGRNEQGELVANGIYFYSLTAGDFTATRKMVIRK